MSNIEQIVVKVAIPKLLCPRVFQMLLSIEPRSRAEKIRSLAYLGELLESGILSVVGLAQNKTATIDSDFTKETVSDKDEDDLADDIANKNFIDINDFADYID